jgi:hypothetical protein
MYSKRLFFLILLLLTGILCHAKRDADAALEQQFVTKRAYQGRNASGFDRAAFVLFGMLAISKDLEAILRKDKTEIAWALALVVSVTVVVDMGMVLARSLASNGPRWCSWIWHKWRQWLMQSLGWSSAFDGHELLLWQQLFDQVMQAALDFGRTRVKLDCEGKKVSPEHADKHWLYYRQYMRDLLMYMATYVTAHDAYYRIKHTEKLYSKFNLFGYAGSDADHICFLITCVAKNLHNIADAFMAAPRAEDLDILHVHALYKVTLGMLKKVRLFTGGALCEKEGEFEVQDSVYEEFAF